MKSILKTIAAVAMLAFATPAFAGGVTVADDGTSKTKLEALFFLNTTNETTDVAGVKTKDSTGLAVDRAYLTLKHSFNSDWMMRLTTDVDSNAGAGLSKQQNIYLKYAYLQGKLVDDAVVLRLGQSHTPWIDYEQHLWGHRYVAKVASDFFKYDTSSDLGIGLKGKLADGMVGYFVTATTGAGYANKVGSTDGIDFNSRVGIYPIDGLTLDVQYMNGYKGTKVFGAAAAAITKSTLMQVMATYGMGKDWRVGANYLINKKENLGLTPQDNGYSVWGTAKFAGNFGAFARFDDITNENAAGAEIGTDQRLTAGVEYSPIKNVTFALAFENRDTKPVGGARVEKLRAGLYSRIKL